MSGLPVVLRPRSARRDYFAGDAGADAASGIGKMLAIRQPAVVLTSVRFMRKGVLASGWPAGLMLNMMGTNNCAE